MQYVLTEEEYKEYVSLQVKKVSLEHELAYYKELTKLYKEDAEQLDKKYTELLVYGIVESNERAKERRDKR